MGDNAFEYVGVPARNLELWQDILRDVEFARGYGPNYGAPGYEAFQRVAASAVEQLWPHVDRAALPAPLHEAVLRSVEAAREPLRTRKLGAPSIDLSHALGTLEESLLGLRAARREEIPLQPYFEAWLAAATSCSNLAPGPVAAQTLGWTVPRAFLRPEQVVELASGTLRTPSFDEVRALLGAWRTRVWIGPAEGAEAERYAGWAARFGEVLKGLRTDLAGMAQRGEAYVGWVAWTGYE